MIRGQQSKLRKKTAVGILRDEWLERFVDKMKCCHKRKIDVTAKKLLKRIDGIKHTMVARSKKYDVECNITVEELRELALNAYGKPCKYSGRILKIDNMVFDHVIPISKGGSSNKENIQVISKFSNNMKGSLMESDFILVLKLLDTLPEEVKKDISIRLAHGVR